MTTKPTLLTVKELTPIVRLSASHIYRLVKKKKIPFVKLGGKVLFNQEKVSKWIESNSY